MTPREHSNRSGLHSIEVSVPGANCPWCFNDALDRVRHLTGVAEVRASSRSGCIEVQHRGAPHALILDTLRTYLHGADDSSHECQMVAVEPKVVASRCIGALPAADTIRRPALAGRMETLVEAMARLRGIGYVHDLAATPNGNLLCRSCGTSHLPESIEIRETVRFEGDSNPDDQAILLALACTDGCLGQYSAAFGPATEAADVLALQRLTPVR
jgi:hypothetical protein